MPFASRNLHRALALSVLVTAVALAGCASSQTSNTDRTAMEQLLISNAVDQSLNRIDFSPLDGHTVFFDESRIDCVDKNYIIASTRARILQSGGKLVEKKEEADIAVEISSGGVGTDQTEMYVGTPKMSVPGPFPVSVPEVKLWNRSTQTGTAKLGLVAYETDSREVIGTGGTILARSDDSNSYLFGMGPWQSGSVRKEVKRQLGRPGWYPLPNSIAFTSPATNGEPSRLRIADPTADEAKAIAQSKPDTSDSRSDDEWETSSDEAGTAAVSPASMDSSTQSGEGPPPAPPAGKR